MFRIAALKLAGLYLGILLVISLFFSLNVYQISVQEFDRGIRGMPGAGRFGNDLLWQLQNEHEQQYEIAKKRIVNRLILTNIFILVGGGMLSYYLALRTLRPIQEAHEAQNRFTADASHELRTPITAMRSEIEVALMNTGITVPEAKHILHSNLEELTKLTALSEGLLSLASAQHSHQLPMSNIPINNIIQTAIDKVLPLAEQKGILLKTSGNEHAMVTANETSIIQAFVILLDNAIKYSPEKTEVAISWGQSGKVATITVKDRGIGIKASDIPHIFERFYRADTSRSKVSSSGYGIGLAIAKNIIDLHRGTIRVTSSVGLGSTFTVQLPLSPINRSAA